jgi:hypothetical protein
MLKQLLVDSPRLYTSTNPWKTTQVFKCIATTREEYTGWIDKLRMSAPPEVEEDDGRIVDSKHKMHWDLIYALEMRVDSIEEELRVRFLPVSWILLSSKHLAGGPNA